VILADQDARQAKNQGATRYLEFVISGKNLGTGALRLGLEVRWLNADGSVRQSEVFRCSGAGASLPANLQQWQVFDFKEYQAAVADLQQKIAFQVEQPMAGKLTVVIETPEGKRLRNLLGGVDKKAGDHTIEWDGLDDFGNYVAPGTYRWRAISHPGIKPNYQFSFYNGHEHFFTPFGPNHGTFEAMCSNRQNVFAAAPLTEGGWALIAMDPEGKWQRGYQQLHGTGIKEVATAVDETYFYVFHDGRAWGTRAKQGNWKETIGITLTRYDIASARPVPYHKHDFLTLTHYEHGPAAANPALRQHYSLGGAALLDGTLYVSSRARNGILKIDAGQGTILGMIQLDAPGALAADRTNKTLLVVSGDRLVRIVPQTGKAKELVGGLKATGLAVAGDGTIYASDPATSTVKVLATSGRLLWQLGEPGGAYQGRWNSARMVNPAGLTMAADGKLWVAENRQNPKRLLAWDVTSREVVYEKLGSPPYGSPGGAFDPQDSRVWLGQRCVWRLDYKTGTAKIMSVMQKNAGHLNGKVAFCHNYRFVHQDGRIFLLGMGKLSLISELMPDGSVRDLAGVSNVHSMLYALNWQRVQPYCDAVEKAFPGADISKRYGNSKWRSAGVLWVDRNGDGDLQEDELEFGKQNTRFGGFGWGERFHDLTLVLPYLDENRVRRIVTLKPDGFLPKGAPAYPSLSQACADSTAFQDELPTTLNYRDINVSAATDSRQNLMLLTDPFMMSLTPQGKINWFYPNPWSGVHGSHKAPLPSVGQLQGTLFSLGSAPLDEAGDVCIIAGNHGRFFAMTTDGMYLDEMFQDCRVAESAGPNLVGGEAFGGFFGQTETGTYILQAGSSGYRIYTLSGLDQVKRSSGRIAVSADMLAAAQRQQAKTYQKQSEKRLATVPGVTSAFRIDGRIDEWRQLPTVAKWQRGSSAISVKAAHDQQTLYLLYQVQDSSPWRNNGTDWTQFFKTGDSLDLQIGTDSGADPKRKQPVPGDVRLLMAPSSQTASGCVAVLYRHRLTEPSSTNPVTFSSPWRAETVADVKRLNAVTMAVEKGDVWYRLEIAIPVAELGLKRLSGHTFRADFGVIFGDSAGRVNLTRSYWANQETGLVNDVPGEIMLHPDRWGSLTFGE
jgi:outer membrane protein assembly factor BamB